MHSHGSGILQRAHGISRVDEHLGGHAAVIEAGATCRPLVHNSHLQSLAPGLGGHIQSRPRSDDNQVELIHVSSHSLRVYIPFGIVSWLLISLVAVMLFVCCYKK
jgi:hypothetical protein